jgi:uncharacterized membrane protein
MNWFGVKLSWEAAALWLLLAGLVVGFIAAAVFAGVNWEEIRGWWQRRRKRKG